LAAALLLAGCTATPENNARRLLIFSHSTGYRHASIEPGVAALRELAAREGFIAEASEDPEIFSSERLAQFDALVLLSTTTNKDDQTSEFFTGPRRAALERFVRGGGGVVAIHAAADGHRSWPWHRRMIGAVFERHPPGTPPGRLHVVDNAHPATRSLPAQLSRTDEWYLFSDFNLEVRLLVALDPVSIGLPAGDALPISWAHEIDEGRIFYTAMGHTSESFAEPLFLEHLAGGLRWITRLEE
jgi:hypothetical protein